MDVPALNRNAGVPPLKYVDGSIRFVIDTGTYRLSAVQKAAYRFADRFTAQIGGSDEGSLPVALTFRPNVAEPDALELARLFFRELLDQELREQIAEETGPLRALILAHAFSRTNLVKRE
jgi:His-Xaa-Ser system protein HxsD